VPLIHGGGQELGLRGGTSPTALIVGLGEAVSSFPTVLDSEYSDFEEIMAGFEYRRNGGEKLVETTWNVTFDDDQELKRFKDE
ncbi:cysteine desulfurase, partial [Vibrio campbellii]